MGGWIFVRGGKRREEKRIHQIKEAKESYQQKKIKKKKKQQPKEREREVVALGCLAGWSSQ